MEEQRYQREKRTIDLAKANGVGCIMYLPVLLVYCLPFYLLWDDRISISTFLHNFNQGVHPGFFILFFLLALIGGIVLHELIHGATWAIFAKKGWQSIKLGVLWKFLTPYCHCKDPLTVAQYTLGALMPFFILGVLPTVAAYLTGSVGLLTFGIFFTVSAVGDFMIVNMIRREPKGSLILDHPSEAGYYVYLLGDKMTREGE